VTPQTTSSHLAKLLSRELLTVERRGRNRYYQLATPLVAQMLEGIMMVACLRAAKTSTSISPGFRDATCQNVFMTI